MQDSIAQAAQVDWPEPGVKALPADLRFNSCKHAVPKVERNLIRRLLFMSGFLRLLIFQMICRMICAIALADIQIRRATALICFLLLHLAPHLIEFFTQLSAALDIGTPEASVILAPKNDRLDVLCPATIDLDKLIDVARPMSRIR